MIPHWKLETLGTLYRIGSSKRVLKSQWKSEGVPFYRGREITRLSCDGFVDNQLFISEEHFAQLSKMYGVPTPGDIVVTAIGTIGNSHVVRETDRFYFKDASVLWMKREVEVNSAFVNLWLKSPTFFEQLDRGNGATVDTLTIEKLKGVVIGLPPLAEQQRIVGILDEAFKGIAAAKANAEQNLRNARALFESYLEEVFTQRGPGWAGTTVRELLDTHGGEIKTGPFGTKLKASEYTEAGVPVISVGEIRLGTIVLHDRTPRVDLGVTARMPEYVLEEGDIVFGRKGGVERSACVTKDQSGWFLGSDGIRLRLPTNCNRRFFAYQLLSPTHRKWMLDQAVGTTMPSLNQKIIERIPIRLCSLRQQDAIVGQFDVLAASTQRLTSIYKRKLSALESLKKSILHQAFTGQL